MPEDNSGLKAVLKQPKVYEALQNVMGARRNRQEFARRMVRAQPGDRILDIGCGTGVLRTHLGDVTYIGYEPNSRYVAAGRRLLGDAAELHVGIFDEQAAAAHAAFDVAVVSAVLHHMDDEQARALFALLASCLKETGRVVTLDGVYVDGQSPIARCIIGKDRGRDVRTPTGYRQLAEPCFGSVTGTVAHKRFIPYTYWLMECAEPAQTAVARANPERRVSSSER